MNPGCRFGSSGQAAGSEEPGLGSAVAEESGAVDLEKDQDRAMETDPVSDPD